MVGVETLDSVQKYLRLSRQKNVKARLKKNLNRLKAKVGGRAIVMGHSFLKLEMKVVIINSKKTA